MDSGNITLTELLDVGYLQLLQDSFARMAGVSASLLSPDGLPLTEASNVPEIWDLIGQNEISRGEVNDVCQRLFHAAVTTGSPAFERFPSLETMFASLPILLEGRLIGCWMFGHFSPADAPDPDWPDCAARYGVSERALKEAHAKLARLSHEQLDIAVSFLKAISHTIVQLIHYNVITLEANEELQALGEKLELTASMLRSFMDSTDVGVFVCDFFSGDILLANRTASSYAGCDPDDLVGRKGWELFGPDATAFSEQNRLLNEDGSPAPPLVWKNHLRDADKWLRVTSQAIDWVDGRLAHMVSFMEVTDQTRFEQKLAQMAFYDENLHLPNTRKLAADLAEGEPDSACLICYDIRRLRKINDVYGRATGDKLLRAVADWLANCAPDNSTLYRVDGDEFCLLLNNCDAAEATSLADLTRDRFSSPWELENDSARLQLFCGVSLGVVGLEWYTGDFDALRGAMDRTLNHSVKTGGVAVYDEALDRASQEHSLLELSLKNCVRNGMLGFDVYYQPITDPITGVWCALEALCRWTSPEIGPVPPLVFIREAEENGLIDAIGYWVLETAVRQCKQWGLDEHPGFLLDVNLSTAQLLDERLVEKAAEILAKYDYPGNRLTLEIAVSSDIHFDDQLVSAIERLRAMGVSMALDDFGTGYASFNNLQELLVGILKIEASFLRGIENDAYLRHLLRIMAELAHASDMLVVVEGIETPAQLEIVMDCGADWLQGFLFGKPQPAGQIENQLISFYQACDEFANVRRGYRNMRALLEDRAGFGLLPESYALLSGCMQLAGRGDIAGALALAAEKLQLDRVLLFARDAGGCYSCREEWRVPGLEPKSATLQGVDFERDHPVWMRLLREDGAICSPDVSALPETVARMLEPLGVRSVAILPPGELPAGFICFADCQFHRDWQPETLLLLHDLTALAFGARRKPASESAPSDPLIGIPGRQTAFRSLQPVLQNAYLTGRAASVCVADIDRLRYINDNYGQATAEALIESTAGLLRALMREGDAAGRTSGGEFMLVLAGRKSGEAESLLNSARDALLGDPNNPEPFSFSFGVADTGEIPYTLSKRYIQGLVAAADRRLHKQRHEFFGDEDLLFHA